ncbi:MAG: DinB family protein [Opitutaceae bacterium]|nr:DinB family protein [Opitutaceae bacterium]
MSPPSPVAAAVAANLAVIRQAIALLPRLGDERFAARHPLCFNASIGGHVRHILEHYQRFLTGLGDGEVDYEKRARDPLVEASAGYALGQLEAAADRLAGLAPALGNRSLHVCAETAPGIATATTVLRELEFLLSHTIHHYALVAVMARLQGCEPDPAFGVAPSTLRFQQRESASCAR